LATPSQDLAPTLLNLTRRVLQNEMFWPNTVNDLATGSNNLIRAQPGMYAPEESVRQMRAMPRQVPGAQISVCHGVGRQSTPFHHRQQIEALPIRAVDA
jgi:hypothetical protein